MSLFASSYIKTTTAAVARVRDQLSFPFTAKPQTMTIYLRFLEIGASLVSGLKLLHIGDSAIFCAIDVNSPGLSTFRLTLATGTVTRTATAAGSPSLGNIVEVRGVLNADGTLTMGMTLNSGAETTASNANATVFPAAWGAATLWINSFGTANVGFGAYRNVLIRRGVLSLNQCRGYAGV